MLLLTFVSARESVVSEKPDFDVLIVGAGLAGISMGVHLQRELPGKSFALFEMRERPGGTWDLFRYPGVRSDSDMQTFAFGFEPWTHPDSLAAGETIRDYMHGVIEKYGLDDAIRYETRVIAADWRADEAMWHVVTEQGGDRAHHTARWLYLGSGYYDYDAPHEADIPGIEDFGGKVVHPQFWPDELDHAGKRVVVIGSGATAITVVPAMAEDAAHVTMLQRTPAWLMNTPGRSWFAHLLHKVLPAQTAHRIMRERNIVLTDWLFRRSRAKPGKMREFLHKNLRKDLGEHFREEDYTPPYNPWEERMCFVRDGDLFKAVKDGRAAVRTGNIAAVEEDGIRLEDGTHLPADIIVTATGLKLAVAGKIAITLGGEEIAWGDRYFYKNTMFDGVPNLNLLAVYLNASATLRMDMVAAWICRVLAHMDDIGAQVATPVMPGDARLEEAETLDFRSGYIQRGKHLLPKSATHYPWKLSHNYREDRKYMRESPIEDGVLSFSRARARAPVEPEPAE